MDFRDFTGVVSSDLGESGFSVNVPPTVPNGNFEMDVADNSIPDFWEPGLRDFAEPFDGKYCLVLPPAKRKTAAHGGSSSFWKEDDPCPFYYSENFIYLLPETKYSLSFQYRYLGSTPMYASVVGFDEKNKNIFNKTLAVERSWPFAWNKAKMDFTTPAGVYKCYLRFSNHSNADSAANCWIDAVELKEAPR